MKEYKIKIRGLNYSMGKKRQQLNTKTLEDLNFSHREKLREVRTESLLGKRMEVTLKHVGWSEEAQDKIEQKEQRERVLQEWIAGSKVDLGIVEKNVTLIPKDLGGRKTDWFARHKILYSRGIADYTWGNNRRKYRHYDHLEQAGGWYVTGEDVIKGGESAWGQIKPTQPRINVEGKAIKYENPLGVPTELIALRVTDEIANRVYERVRVKHKNLEAPGSGEEFWTWVKANPEVGLIVTEGAKKAGCLLSLGYAAVALPGIWNGCPRPKDKRGRTCGKPTLIPQLAAFLDPKGKRVFTLCYDNDKKRKTRENSRLAQLRLGRLLGKQTNRIDLGVVADGKYKGVDDLVAEEGRETFEECYAQRKSVNEIEIWNFEDFFTEYDEVKVVKVTGEDKLDTWAEVTDCEELKDKRLIGICSGKGTGKTELMRGAIDDTLLNARQVIGLTHRQTLRDDLARRTGVEVMDKYTDRRRGGILCVDSLDEFCSAGYSIDKFEEPDLYIDEATQVVFHAMDSKTCQKRRKTILVNLLLLLVKVVETGGRVFIADADLDLKTIKFFEGLMGIGREEVGILNNTYKTAEGVKLYTYDSPEQVLLKATRAVESGKKILFLSSGQKVESTWGTTNLEEHFKRAGVAEKDLVRIDSQTVSDPDHKALGCMKDLGKFVTNYQVVLGSPIMETGVDLSYDHFDEVYCLAQGYQTTGAVRQALGRVRSKVDRHLFAKTTVNKRIGNGSSDWREFLKAEETKYEEIYNSISRADDVLLTGEAGDFLDDGEVPASQVPPIYKITWAKTSAQMNLGFKYYRQNILEGLAAEGYEIIRVKDEEENDKDSKAEEEILEGVKKNMVEIREQKHSEHCTAVSNAEDIMPRQLDKLSNQPIKSKKERNEERKGWLNRFYKVPVTPELVKEHDDGMYSQLVLLFYYKFAQDKVTERDRSRILPENLFGRRHKLFIKDANDKGITLKIDLLNRLGLDRFMDSKATFTSESLRGWFEECIKPNIKQIQNILGVTVAPTEKKLIGAANRILKVLGLKLEYLGKRGPKGGQARVYVGCKIKEGIRGQIIDKWTELVYKEQKPVVGAMALITPQEPPFLP